MSSPEYRKNLYDKLCEVMDIAEAEDPAYDALLDVADMMTGTPRAFSGWENFWPKEYRELEKKVDHE